MVSPTVLVACESAVDRLRIESALLPLRAEVRQASSVVEAIEAVGSTARTAFSACISDMQLPGGGALGLARALGGIPVLARGLAPSPLAAQELRDAGVVGTIDPLSTAGELRVRIAATAALDTREGCGGRFSVPVLDLPAADIIAWVSAHRWSAVARFHTEPGGPARFALRFREGSLWSADGPELTGERALAAVLGLVDGIATVTRDDSGGAAPTIRAPRNIHRTTEDAVLESLASSNRARHRLSTVPGLDITYRLVASRAERIPGAREVTERLRRVMDGRRTLRQAMAAAGLVEPSDLERVADLRRVGAFEPTTGAVLPEPEPLRVELLTGARALAAEVERTIGPSPEVVRRRRASPTEEFVSIEELESKRRRSRLWLTGLTLLAFALALAGIIWAATDQPDGVRVEVLSP